MRDCIPDKNEGRVLFLILALALILRLAFVILPANGVPFSDMQDYHDKACALLATGSYGAALRPPLYPLFLAAVYRFAGMDYIFIRSIQALMGVGVCLLAYAIARRLYGPRAGIAAGLIVACYPSLVIYTCLLMSENLFMLLFTASLLLLGVCPSNGSRRVSSAGRTDARRVDEGDAVRIVEDDATKQTDGRHRNPTGRCRLRHVSALLRPRRITLDTPSALRLDTLASGWRRGRAHYSVRLLKTAKRRWLTCFAAGVLLGLACLTRSVLVGFVPLSALWLAVRRERVAALCCLLGALFAIAPWTARNWRYYHCFVPIDTYGGYNFLLGNNPDASGRQSREVVIKLRQTVWKQCRDDAHRAAIGYREGLGFIAAHPGRFLDLGIGKMGYLYGPEIRELSWGYSRNFFGPAPPWLLIPAATAVVAAFPLIAFFALLGICLRGMGQGGWRGGGGLLILAMLYFSAAHFITFGESRFHLPLVPILAVFAGSLAWRGREAAEECPTRIPRIVIVALLLALLCLNCAIRLGEDWERLGKILGPGGNTAELDY